jgi:hypothetical protein
MPASTSRVKDHVKSNVFRDLVLTMSATALNMGLIKSDVRQETHRGSATGDERRCWKDLLTALK